MCLVRARVGLFQSGYFDKFCEETIAGIHNLTLIIQGTPLHKSTGPVAYLGFHFGGGSKFFWKSGGLCMARSAMQRVAKPRVC